MIASTKSLMPVPAADVPPTLPRAGLQYGRILLNQLPWAGNHLPGPLHTLGVTSSRSGEGVSTVVLQLAFAAALSEDHRVLLVDCRAERPAVARLLDVAAAPGLTDILIDRRPPSEVIQATRLPALSVLAAGSGDAAACDSVHFPELIESVKHDYEFVLFDLPPVGESSEAVGMATQLDGVLFVVEAEQTQRDDALRAKELLLRAGARVVGAVLNKQLEHLPNWLRRTN